MAGESKVSEKCILRVSARLNRLDRGYTELTSEFRSHAKDLADHVENSVTRHRDFNESMKGLREEVHDSTKLLHGRVNQTLKVFWTLMLSVAGFIIISLMGLVLKIAYDGLPWETVIEVAIP